jgi:dienelactone hydrolase
MDNTVPFRHSRFCLPYLQGECFEPQSPTPANRRTALVIVPSSAGITDVRERAYAQFFAAHGLVCLIPDPFSMAGVTQCLNCQAAVPDTKMLCAARAAYAQLAARKDVGNIGIMGVSKGGLAALHAAMAVPSLPPFMGRFAFHLCLAPPASIQLRTLCTTGAPVLMLLGSKDDFTEAAPAQAYAQRMLAANPTLWLDCRVVAGAHHAWESRGAVRYLPDAERYAHCLFYWENDGSYTDSHTGRHLLAKDFWQELSQHATHGAHVGGGTDALFAWTCRTLLNFIKEIKAY